MPRAFWLTLLGVNASGAVAGAIYALREDVPARAAAPIVAAFLLHISFYLVPGFPEVRRKLEDRFPPVRLAALILAASLAPYLLYSLLTGVFRLAALLELAVICAIPAFVFVLWPTRHPGLTWQDLVAGGTIAAAVLGRAFPRIYLSPVEGLRVDSMGRFMILALGATAFLSLRRLEGSGFQFRVSAEDWKAGLRQFGWFLPVGAALGWATGFAAWRPAPVAAWAYPFLVLGTFLGIYAVVALFEELFFRGVLQNLAAVSLGSAAAAQVVAAIAFGLSHLTFRDFPNWRFALVSAVAGWFYGRAYRERRSVVASSIVHGLVVTTWRVLFSG